MYIYIYNSIYTQYISKDAHVSNVVYIICKTLVEICAIRNLEHVQIHLQSTMQIHTHRYIQTCYIIVRLFQSIYIYAQICNILMYLTIHTYTFDYTHRCENKRHHLQIIFPGKPLVFHIYVSLPQGIYANIYNIYIYNVYIYNVYVYNVYI